MGYNITVSQVHSCSGCPPGACSYTWVIILPWILLYCNGYYIVIVFMHSCSSGMPAMCRPHFAYGPAALNYYIIMYCIRSGRAGLLYSMSSLYEFVRTFVFTMSAKRQGVSCRGTPGRSLPQQIISATSLKLGDKASVLFDDRASLKLGEETP